jgi:radical SAM protein with 4Fe4S-binding SPASM domain
LLSAFRIPIKSYYQNKEEALLFHLERPIWLKVNKTALKIISFLQNTQSLKKTASKLSQKYNISYHQAFEDINHVFEELKSKGFVSKEKSEAPKRKADPQSLFLHITSRCNLSCPHCYYPSDPSKSRDVPMDKLIPLVEEGIDLGIKAITLSGGEPLCHPEIRTILESCRDRLTVQLLTNGTLIDKEWAEFLADRDIQIQVSLDGPTAEIHDNIRGQDNFEKSLHAVDRLQKAGLKDRITLATTVSSHNIKELEEMISLSKALDVPKIRFLPVRRMGTASNNWQEVGSQLTVEDYESFFDFARQAARLNRPVIDISCGLSGLIIHDFSDKGRDWLWCPIGRSIVVDTGGNAYPCAPLMAESFHLGNVFEKGLKDIFFSEKMSEMCDVLGFRKEKITGCRICQWKNFCQAGCMGQALDHRGSIWETDDFCDYRKRAYDKIFRSLLEEIS